MEINLSHYSWGGWLKVIQFSLFSRGIFNAVNNIIEEAFYQSSTLLNTYYFPPSTFIQSSPTSASTGLAYDLNRRIPRQQRRTKLAGSDLLWILLSCGEAFSRNIQDQARIENCGKFENSIFAVSLEHRLQKFCLIPCSFCFCLITFLGCLSDWPHEVRRNPFLPNSSLSKETKHLSSYSSSNTPTHFHNFNWICGLDRL